MHRRSLANTNRHAAVASAAAAILLVSTTARAQQQSASTFESPPVTLTGTRLPMTSRGMAQTITVVDDKEIQQTNPAGVEDAVSRSHVLIMIDSVRVNDPTTTRGSAYDLSSIDIYQLDRIEVLRGPASAIYTGSFIDRSNPTGDIDMPSYTGFDMAYSIQFGWARLKLAVDNQFGTNYEQFVGFPAMQRRFRFELRAAF